MSFGFGLEFIDSYVAKIILDGIKKSVSGVANANANAKKKNMVISSNESMENKKKIKNKNNNNNNTIATTPNSSDITDIT